MKKGAQKEPYWIDRGKESKKVSFAGLICFENDL